MKNQNQIFSRLYPIIWALAVTCLMFCAIKAQAQQPRPEQSTYTFELTHISESPVQETPEWGIEIPLDRGSQISFDLEQNTVHFRAVGIDQTSKITEAGKLDDEQAVYFQCEYGFLYIYYKNQSYIYQLLPSRETCFRYKIKTNPTKSYVTYR